MPTEFNLFTNSFEDPSYTGISLESISIKTLSISNAYKADNMCSTVETVFPYESDNKVHNFVDLTF